MTDYRTNSLSESAKDFHRMMRQALVRKGWIIPRTVEEVRWAEEAHSERPAKIPKEISNPEGLISKLSSRKGRTGSARILSLRPTKDKKTEARLAHAARKGGDIPEEVREAMDKDREEAERRAGRPSNESNEEGL